MMASTHITLGLGCWIGYSQMRGLPLQPIPMMLAGFGSLLPDIDHPKSFFGSKILFISYPLSALFGHRGVTHSLFAIVAGAFLLYAYGFELWFVAPLVVGYLSHVLGDVLTNSGAPLLWPRKDKVSLPLFNTGSILEGLFRLALLAIVLWMVFNQLKWTLKL